MTAKTITAVLSNYFMKVKNHVAFMTEVVVSCGSIADIITINKDGACCEIEIKLNKVDLIKELEIMNDALENRDYIGDGYKKHLKHKMYIDRDVSNGGIMPELFYIAVPGAFVSIVKEVLRVDDYGIIAINNIGSKQSIKTIRTAKKLYNYKLDLKKYSDLIIKRLSAMNNRLLKEAHLRPKEDEIDRYRMYMTIKECRNSIYDAEPQWYYDNLTENNIIGFDGGDELGGIVIKVHSLRDYLETLSQPMGM